ncbi:UNKNOWN [Stylonychia lemnae]|uniref:Serine aminopeptidase S33 domain-containing protein n=1 Tax=Stylonychia lemnae TaxID=5949 RepID=A0A078ARQ4_STYLE|nr:UNKNOWN [Stylonychia lemnae]|eukprot:CDW83543.1 UNKNOWN [Stylonychia lemnae]
MQSVNTTNASKNEIIDLSAIRKQGKAATGKNSIQSSGVHSSENSQSAAPTTNQIAFSKLRAFQKQDKLNKISGSNTGNNRSLRKYDKYSEKDKGISKSSILPPTPKSNRSLIISSSMKSTLPKHLRGNNDESSRINATDQSININQQDELIKYLQNNDEIGSMQMSRIERQANNQNQNGMNQLAMEMSFNEMGSPIMTTNYDDDNPQPRPISVIEGRFNSVPQNIRDRSIDNRTPLMMINTESEVQDDDFHKQFQQYKDITRQETESEELKQKEQQILDYLISQQYEASRLIKIGSIAQDQEGQENNENKIDVNLQSPISDDEEEINEERIKVQVRQADLISDKDQSIEREQSRSQSASRRQHSRIKSSRDPGNYQEDNPYQNDPSQENLNRVGSIIDVKIQMEQNSNDKFEYQVKSQSSTLFNHWKSQQENEKSKSIVKPIAGLETLGILTEKDINLIGIISQFINNEYNKTDFMRDLQYFIRHYDQQSPTKYKQQHKKVSRDHFPQFTQRRAQSRRHEKIKSRQAFEQEQKKRIEENQSSVNHGYQKQSKLDFNSANNTIYNSPRSRDQRITYNQKVSSVPQNDSVTQKISATLQDQFTTRNKYTDVPLTIKVNQITEQVQVSKRRFNEAIEEYEIAQEELNAFIIDSFRNIPNPQSEDFNVGGAFVLLIIDFKCEQVSQDEPQQNQKYNDFDFLQFLCQDIETVPVESNQNASSFKESQIKLQHQPSQESAENDPILEQQPTLNRDSSLKKVQFIESKKRESNSVDRSYYALNKVDDIKPLGSAGINALNITRNHFNDSMSKRSKNSISESIRNSPSKNQIKYVNKNESANNAHHSGGFKPIPKGKMDIVRFINFHYYIIVNETNAIPYGESQPCRASRGSAVKQNYCGEKQKELMSTQFMICLIKSNEVGSNDQTPKNSYSYLTFLNEMIYVPKSVTKNSKTTISYIPCLFIPYKPRRSGEAPQCLHKDKDKQMKAYRMHKLLVYFHGNAEDVGHSYEFLYQVGQKFHLNILSVEYPGYGIYRNEEPDSETILLNSQIIFDYVTQSLKFDPKDIILFGRSMGSGPACQLSSVSKPAALILLSPYTSLKDAVKSLLGTIPSMIVRERFKNIEVIKKVSCPTLIVHGQSDQLIPFSHSQHLHINCGGPSKLIMPKRMTHNEFDLQKDLFEPIKQFFIESNILTSSVKGNVQLIKEKYFFPPKNLRNQAGPVEQQVQSKLQKNRSQPQLVPLSMLKADIQQPRDVSPVPQSEEKQKLEIRDSVKAKNIKGIDPSKKLMLCRSVKEKNFLTSRNYNTQNTLQSNKDTLVQEEERDQINVKIWKSLFDKKSQQQQQ